AEAPSQSARRVAAEVRAGGPARARGQLHLKRRLPQDRRCRACLRRQPGADHLAVAAHLAVLDGGGVAPLAAPERLVRVQRGLSPGGVAAALLEADLVQGTGVVGVAAKGCVETVAPAFRVFQ